MLVSKLLTPEKQQKQFSRILRFIFEYLIECYELKQQVSTSFFLNQLVTLLITSPPTNPKKLQFLVEFQNNLPKLMTIGLSKVSGVNLLKVLCKNTDYQQLIHDNDDIKTLNSFINNHSELKLSDPIMVILNDAIEKKFDEEKPDQANEDIIDDKMIEVKNIILTAPNVSFQMIIALAYFKRVAKLFANDILLAINEQEEDYPFL